MGTIELAQPVTVTIPSRYVIQRMSNGEALSEIKDIAEVIKIGSEAICGAYVRLCDTIRQNRLTDAEVRKALKDIFPASRISELLRVANAPETVWRYYRSGAFGFKGALQGARLYGITRSDYLVSRQKKRAAERLISLIGEGEEEEIKISNWLVQIRKLDL